MRMMCERSRVRRRPTIPCCKRSSDAEPTAKALFRRRLLDLWRTCSVGPRMRRPRDVLTQDGGTVDPGDERGEMATLDTGRATGTSLGRTDANDECPSQECTASEHWQPGVPSSPIRVCLRTEENWR